MKGPTLKCFYGTIPASFSFNSLHTVGPRHKNGVDKRKSVVEVDQHKRYGSSPFC